MLKADETDKIETNLKKSKLESATIYIFPRQAQIYGRKE
jgi:hypothetical protein